MASECKSEKNKTMEKLIIVIERSSDHFGAYSENCEGIYAAGDSLDAVKSDTYEAIKILKENLPESQWPDILKDKYEVEWKIDVPSFLEFYSKYMSLAGMEKITGINQKQLSNYLNHRSVPRPRQTKRIRDGIHRFAEELLSITL